MFNEITTWVAMVELPAFAALFRMVLRNKKEADAELEQAKAAQEQQILDLKDALADFKLHVARNYVSVNYLKDVESRLTNHLLRIEKKLDEVGKNR